MGDINSSTNNGICILLLLLLLIIIISNAIFKGLVSGLPQCTRRGVL